MVQLLAGFLHRRDEPPRLQAPSAPCLSFVGRVAILGLELATTELADAVRAVAIHRQFYVRGGFYHYGLELLDTGLFQGFSLGFQFADLTLNSLQGGGARHKLLFSIAVSVSPIPHMVVPVANVNSATF